MNETLIKRLDGRAQFFEEAPLEAANSNLQKSADLFREAARELEAYERLKKLLLAHSDGVATLQALIAQWRVER